MYMLQLSHVRCKPFIPSPSSRIECTEQVVAAQEKRSFLSALLYSSSRQGALALCLVSHLFHSLRV